MDNINTKSSYRTKHFNDFIESERQQAANSAGKILAEQALREKRMQERDSHNKMVKRNKFIAKTLTAMALFSFTSTGKDIIGNTTNSISEKVAQTHQKVRDNFTDGDETNRTYEPGDVEIAENARLRTSPKVQDMASGETNSKDVIDRPLYVDGSSIKYDSTDQNGDWYSIPGEELSGTNAEKLDKVYINEQNIDFEPESEQ